MRGWASEGSGVVGEDQEMMVVAEIGAGRRVLPADQFLEPSLELLAAFHLADRQLAHLSGRQASSGQGGPGACHTRGE